MPTATQSPVTQVNQASAKANPFNPNGGIVAPGVSAPVSGGTTKEAVKTIGVELIAVVIATVIADTSPKAATAMVWLFGALWLLFLINHYGK